MTYLRSTYALLVAALLLLMPGCSSQRLYAPSAVLADVHVKVYDAYIKRGDHVWVKMMVFNNTDVPVELDRDGIALRLPSGKVLPRASGVTTRHEPYTIAPGQRRRVYVDFRADDDVEADRDLYLVMGGVRFAGEDQAQIIGEIPLFDSFDQLARNTEIAGSTAPPKVPPKSKPEVPATPPPVAEVPKGAAAPPPVPAATGPHTVGIDLSRLEREDFDEVDGVALEQRLLVRLVQDGFAVVAAAEKPDTLVVVTREGDSVVLEVKGQSYTEAREVADSGQAREVLHHELAQKCSALVHHAASREN